MALKYYRFHATITAMLQPAAVFVQLQQVVHRLAMHELPSS